MAGFKKGDKVRLIQDDSWRQPCRKWAVSGRVGTVVQVMGCDLFRVSFLGEKPVKRPSDYTRIFTVGDLLPADGGA